MTTLQNDRLLRALLRQPVDRTPVWVMRQAGRYLPEYQALRKKTPNFMEFCQNPELAAAATMMPLARFALDAGIIFSDILTIPDAMGMQLEFIPGKGPVFHDPIRTANDVAKLKEIEAGRDLSYVMQAIQLTLTKLQGRLPLIGFSGSPWTLATYMIEGGSSKLFHAIKTMMYQKPTVLKQLLLLLAESIVDYLNAQIRAGAHAIMVFDTWGGVLSTQDYQEFSLYYLKHIAQQLIRDHQGRRIPLVFFTKNGGQWLELIAESGCDAVGLDWTTDIAQAKQRVGDRVALQGNLDPSLLFADAERIQTGVYDVLRAYGGGTGHVFNLGHGIHKDTPIAGMEAMLAALNAYHEECVV